MTKISRPVVAITLTSLTAALACREDPLAPGTGTGGLAIRLVTPPRPVPTAAAAESNPTMGAANSFTCGVSVTGAEFCWGENFEDQLGNGDTSIRTSPEVVVGGLRFQRPPPITP